jgi:hypothetical protein
VTGLRRPTRYRRWPTGGDRSVTSGRPCLMSGRACILRGDVCEREGSWCGDPVRACPGARAGCRARGGWCPPRVKRWGVIGGPCPRDGERRGRARAACGDLGSSYVHVSPQCALAGTRCSENGPSSNSCLAGQPANKGQQVPPSREEGRVDRRNPDGRPPKLASDRLEDYRTG